MKVQELLETRNFTGNEKLAHVISGEIQTAIAWAEEFVSEINSGNDCYKWEDFSDLVEVDE